MWVVNMGKVTLDTIEVNNFFIIKVVQLKDKR